MLCKQEKKKYYFLSLGCLTAYLFCAKKQDATKGKARK